MVLDGRDLVQRAHLHADDRSGPAEAVQPPLPARDPDRRARRARAGMEPSGFVFHGSRCGSTLVSGMLASVPQFLVLSEPLPVDDLLRANAAEADKVRWLRSLVSALGRRRHGDERAFVLKLDAWSALDLAIVRHAFPDVPWVFLFRRPVQVLASHFRQRGAHMVPGAIDPELFGLDRESIAAMPPEEYCARVLAAIFRSALEHRDRAGALRRLRRASRGPLRPDPRRVRARVRPRRAGAHGEGDRLRREEPAALLRARR